MFFSAVISQLSGGNGFPFVSPLLDFRFLLMVVLVGSSRVLGTSSKGTHCFLC